MRVAIVSVGILIIAVLMAMTGRGGGNSYVPFLVAAGAPMHQAATTGQLILVAAAAALLVFQSKRTVDWRLALVVEPPADAMALVGGYFAHAVAGSALKSSLRGSWCSPPSSCFAPQRKAGSKRANGSAIGGDVSESMSTW